MECAAVKEKLWGRDYIIILVCTFLSSIPFWMLLTAFPIYIIDVFQETEQTAGLMNTVFLLGAVIIRPISGKMVDDYGSKRIIVISMSLFIISNTLYLVIHNINLLLAVRFINGVFFAVSSTSLFTAAAHIIPLSRQGEGIGYASTVANLGTVFGPFIGLSFAGHVLFNWMFIFACLVLIVGLVFALLIDIPETLKETTIVETGVKSRLFEKSTLPLASLMFLMGVSYSSILSFYPIYAREINLLTAASYFFLVYAIASLLSRIIVGIIYDSYGVNAISYPAIISFAIGMLILSQSHTMFFVLGAGVLIGVGYGSLVPIFQTLSIQIAPANRKGAVTATYYTFLDGGISFGSFVLGGLIAHIGYVNMYISVALLIFLSILFYYWIYSINITRVLRRDIAS